MSNFFSFIALLPTASSGGGGGGLDSYISNCKGSNSAGPPMEGGGGAKVAEGVPKSWRCQKMGVLPAPEMKGLGFLRQSMRGGGGGGCSELNRLFMS